MPPFVVVLDHLSIVGLMAKRFFYCGNVGT